MIMMANAAFSDHENPQSDKQRDSAEHKWRFSADLTYMIFLVRCVWLCMRLC